MLANCWFEQFEALNRAINALLGASVGSKLILQYPIDAARANTAMCLALPIPSSIVL